MQLKFVPQSELDYEAEGFERLSREFSEILTLLETTFQPFVHPALTLEATDDQNLRNSFGSKFQNWLSTCKQDTKQWGEQVFLAKQLSKAIEDVLPRVAALQRDLVRFQHLFGKFEEEPFPMAVDDESKTRIRAHLAALRDHENALSENLTIYIGIRDEALAKRTQAITSALVFVGSTVVISAIPMALGAAGFGSGGVVAGSTAARVQSVAYGAKTRGLFSVCQRIGAKGIASSRILTGAVGLTAAAEKISTNLHGTNQADHDEENKNAIVYVPDRFSFE